MEKVATALSLQRIIPDNQLNEWEHEELIEQLAGYDELLARAVLEQIAVIWPVSHALCFAFLEQLHNGLLCLETGQLAEWVKGILHAYEADGLRAARLYMADVENNFLCQLRGESGLTLAEARGRLAPYVRGISGRPLQLEPAAAAATDTATIFLPRDITFYREPAANFQVYKLLATFQWGFISQDLYCQQQARSAAIHFPGDSRQQWEGDHDDLLAHFFKTFADQQLAQDIYHLLQTLRVAVFLRQEFPGLLRDMQPFFGRLLVDRPELQRQTGLNYLLEKIRQWLLGQLSGDKAGGPGGHPLLAALVEAAWSGRADNAAIITATRSFYDAFAQAGPAYEPLPPLLFQGEFLPREAHRVRLARRENTKQKFIEALAALLPQPASGGEPQEAEEKEAKPPSANVLETGTSITPFRHHKAEQAEALRQPGEEPRFICLDDEHLKLPEELRDLAREIEEDLGGLPAFYIASASQRAGGQGKSPARGPLQEEGEALQGGLLYDEWDFRRQGFRRNWCRLHRKQLHAVKGTFVGNTLEKYRGQIMQLKRQFEMLRTRHLFVGRQRDGEDVDLDALTEACADVKAGLVPSERLYVRLQRDVRDIAALFLVDMSSSTEGWVGTALKESLVLLSEALAALGDRYAIYGFSGMRRTRSEIYHIKGFAESYTDEIRGRIAAIAPVDYTRMGPPIRHFTGLLSRLDARVRLLIILTDGKPEDYDDYKGEYAIEDTRHALIEAKNAGIHPFCITIDRQAQDYMGHMFGEINYTFINDVRKLPIRVPEIYRMLTS
ncbi:MAG: nitric oxide reductase activation protein NorD [Thermodesulfobacteriota bacterium]